MLWNKYSEQKKKLKSYEKLYKNEWILKQQRLCNKWNKKWIQKLNKWITKTKI